MESNRALGDTTLSELLRQHKREIMISFNCHAIGVIEEFNSENQTVKAKIAYKKLFKEKGKEILVDYPVLIDCPAVVLSGGSFSIKMPIKKGDECLVLFNDRAIDNWFQSGEVKKIDSPRLHSFADGIVLVGLRSLAKSIQGYEEEKVKIGDETHDLILGDGEAAIKNGDAQVSVKSKINISNSSQNLLDALVAICDALDGFTSTNAAIGSPVSAGPATKIAVAQAKSKIEGLLE